MRPGIGTLPAPQLDGFDLEDVARCVRLVVRDASGPVAEFLDPGENLLKLRKPLATICGEWFAWAGVTVRTSQRYDPLLIALFEVDAHHIVHGSQPIVLGPRARASIRNNHLFGNNHRADTGSAKEQQRVSDRPDAGRAALQPCQK